MNKKEHDFRVRRLERRRRIMDKIEEFIIWGIIGAIGAMLGLVFIGEYLLRV